MMCARSTAATAEDPAEAVAGAAAEAVAEAGTTSAETIGVIAACSEAAARAGTEAGETSAADDMGAIAKGVRATNPVKKQTLRMFVIFRESTCRL